MKYMIGPNGSFVSEDELYHWKYIKREKQPDGKWKYYYDTKQLKNDLGVNARAEYQKLNFQYNRSAQRNDKTFKDWTNYTLSKNYDYKNPVQNAVSTELRIRGEAAKKVYDDWSKKNQEAYSKYMNTPLGKLSKMTKPIEDGAKAVSNFFSKTFKKTKRPDKNNRINQAAAKAAKRQRNSR